MFSDILTPLTGMNVPFDILEKEGPVVASPVRRYALQVTPRVTLVDSHAPAHAR